MKCSILALVTLFVSLWAAYTCPGESHCIPAQCPDEILMTAAELLFQNWFSIIDTKSLDRLQGIITKDSILNVVTRTGDKCTEIGSVNYLENIVPMIPSMKCSGPVTDLMVFMKDKSKVVAIGFNVLSIGILGINSTVFKVRHVLEVVNGCELKLARSEVIQEDCI